MYWVVISGNFNTRGFKVFFLVEDTPDNQSSSCKDLAKSRTYHEAQMNLRLRHKIAIFFYFYGLNLLWNGVLFKCNWLTIFLLSFLSKLIWYISVLIPVFWFYISFCIKSYALGLQLLFWYKYIGLHLTWYIYRCYPDVWDMQKFMNFYYFHQGCPMEFLIETLIPFLSITLNHKSHW